MIYIIGIAICFVLYVIVDKLEERHWRKREEELDAWLWDKLSYGKEFQEQLRKERLEQEQQKGFRKGTL